MILFNAIRYEMTVNLKNKWSGVLRAVGFWPVRPIYFGNIYLTELMTAVRRWEIRNFSRRERSVVLYFLRSISYCFDIDAGELVDSERYHVE